MPVSQNHRRLARMLDGELNRRIGRLAVDVALERGGVPIAVEYDGWYSIDRLLAGEERVVLTLPDWGVGRARGLAWEPARPPRPYRRRHGAAHA